ncbi:19374_t:CDS:2, partial [Rhizophagus irregularis]
CTIPPEFWYSKVNLLATYIRTVFKTICIPSSNVFIDEMIARFSGRSAHIVRIKNKPTPKGACGTVRTNSANFPKVLKANKKLDWNTLSGVVVNNVLAILWMDNGSVMMLSTIHQIDNENENQIERVRCRPRETSTNAAKI